MDLAHDIRCEADAFCGGSVWHAPAVDYCSEKGLEDGEAGTDDSDGWFNTGPDENVAQVPGHVNVVDEGEVVDADGAGDTDTVVGYLLVGVDWGKGGDGL